MIAETVQIGQEGLRQIVGAQRDDGALGAPANRPRHVEEGAGRAPAGQRGQIRLPGVDLPLQGLDPLEREAELPPSRPDSPPFAP